MSWTQRACVGIGAGVGLSLVGLVGAGLFNPDDGSLVHSEALWRVFGIGAYLGAAMFWISTLTAAILGLATVLSRVRRGTCH